MRHSFDFRSSLLVLLSLFAFAMFNHPASVSAQAGAVGMDPTRIEVVIPAGSEKTIGTTIDYSREVEGVELPLARLVARMEDWTITPEGDVRFAPVNTMPRSAASWVTASTSEFTLTADSRRVVRYTISVPKDTPPGDYYFAAYVESRDAPPPPKEGEKRITISFRRYLLVYVLVPDLKFEGELTGLTANVVNGLPVVKPTLQNKGNSRLRPMHSFEIRDAADKVVFSSPQSESRVLLGGHTLQMPYIVEAKLPVGQYKLAYKIDFGDKKAIQVGKTAFQITEEDVAARKNLENQTTAEQNNELEKAAPVPTKDSKSDKTESGSSQAQKTGDAQAPVSNPPSTQNESNGLTAKKPIN